MTSLRRTALVWMTVLLALVGVVAVLISYEFARREAGTFLDGQLRQISLNAGEGFPESAGPPVDHDPEDEFSVMIWDAQGTVAHRSPSDIDIPRQDRLGFTTIRAAGDRWRVYTSSDGVRTVQVAQRTSVRDELAESAALDAALPILLVIPVAWLVIGWAMNRLLGRLDTLTARIAAQTASSLEPLPIAGVPLELVPLIKAMNNLIARLEGALAQQRQFLSDAAHELRTPLAALQILVDGLKDADPRQLPERRAQLAQGVKRAGGLVKQLLRLAKLEAYEAELPKKDADLLDLILTSVASHIEIAQSKGVDLGIVEQASLPVRGAPAELLVLLDNLLDNAVRYTAEGGTVDVAIRRIATGGEITITDTGRGIPADAVDRIFDRFARAAPVEIEGTGLGLSIARRIAERHGYEIGVFNRTDGQRGVIARVAVPAAAIHGAAADTGAPPRPEIRLPPSGVLGGKTEAGLIRP
jgi:two-component system OmpR family sensor kinase